MTLTLNLDLTAYAIEEARRQLPGLFRNPTNCCMVEYIGEPCEGHVDSLILGPLDMDPTYRTLAAVLDQAAGL
jgi:hypothetical protein